jgi:cytochrome P450
MLGVVCKLEAGRPSKRLNTGPIVRITPNEVHIDDPDFFSTVYSSGKSKVNKDPSTVVGFGHPGATASTVDHDQHSIRRGYLSHRYSKRAVDALVPLVNERIDALCARFEGALKTGLPISLDRAFSAMAADVIYAQFFGAHLNYLSDPNLSVPWRDAFIGLSAGFHTSRFIPNLFRMLKKLRPSVLKLILRYLNTAQMTSLFDLQDQSRQTIQRILDENDSGSPATQSVIGEAVSNPDIPPQDRTVERLVDDGMIFGFAGTETLGRSLAVGAFYLLSDKPILAKLRAELAAATEKSPNEELTLDELEKLPYLVFTSFLDRKGRFY